MGIGDPPDWRRARTLAIDTSAFIYHLEAHPTHASRLLPIFRHIEGGRCRGVSSTLTFLEVLVQPCRTRDDDRRAAVSALLASFPGMTWVPMDLAVADRAAFLRGRYRLRTPDAIHLATALHTSVDVFLTNDRDLRRVEEVPVLLIDECGRETLRQALRREAAALVETLTPVRWPLAAVSRGSAKGSRAQAEEAG